MCKGPGWLASWWGKHSLYGFIQDILMVEWICMDFGKSSSTALKLTIFVILYGLSQCSESFFDVCGKQRLSVDNQTRSPTVYASASEHFLSAWTFMQFWAFSRLFLISSKILVILSANPLVAGAFEIWDSIPILGVYKCVTLKGDFLVEACCFKL